MEVTLNIDTQFKVESLSDLPRLGKVIKQMKLKINKSKLARDLGKNRKTIEKYLNGFIPKAKRDKPSKIDDYYQVIASLLSEDSPQEFYYMRVLWQYLRDNHGLQCSISAFRAYINQHKEFEAYFKSSLKIKSPHGTPRFETDAGKQAQLDWKENIDFLTSEGEIVNINVAVLVLSHSRFRFFHLSLNKTQESLFSFLTQCFEKMGGVPEQLVTDNMKTVMDEARTEFHKGKINQSFSQFAKDFGFKVHPCIAGRPRTKGKVETQMKLLDEIHAYQGQLTLLELARFIEKLCERVNTSLHQGSGKIPLLEFQAECQSFKPLPSQNIRAFYKIKAHYVKVNTSNMVTYHSNQYSVPSGYIGKQVELQVIDGQLWIAYQARLIAQHSLSTQKLNYHVDHYKEALKTSTGKHYDIDALAQKNLETMSEVFKR